MTKDFGYEHSGRFRLKYSNVNSAEPINWLIFSRQGHLKPEIHTCCMQLKASIMINIIIKGQFHFCSQISENIRQLCCHLSKYSSHLKTAAGTYFYKYAGSFQPNMYVYPPDTFGTGLYYKKAVLACSYTYTSECSSIYFH